MASIDIQDLSLTKHHTLYDAIDPTSALKNSASGKVVFITGGSRGIGQATAVAFAKARAKAVYITTRSEQALEKTRDRRFAVCQAASCTVYQQPRRARLENEQGQTEGLRLFSYPKVRRGLLPHLQLPADHG